MIHRIFVYGSLKRNFHNHSLLSSSKFVTTTRTKNAFFDMISLGSFPAVLASGNSSIEGELYEVDDNTLARLDRLEGEGSWYKRVMVALVGQNKPAWMYVMIHNDYEIDYSCVDSTEINSVNVLNWNYKSTPSLYTADEEWRKIFESILNDEEY